MPLAVGVPVLAGELDALPGGLRALATVAALLVAATGVLVVPQLRWRRWRWAVRDEEVDLRHGAFTEIRTIVPMARIQHVDVRRSPLGRTFDTADLVVHTAAGATTIPMLPEEAALAARDRIIGLTSSVET